MTEITLTSSLRSETDISNMDVLEELRISEGINVWSSNQETLEEQASKELELIAETSKQLTSNHNNLEDGEIVDNDSKKEVKNTKNILDIESYIKKQEELKKRHVSKKTSEISDKSKEYAQKISKLQKKRGKRKSADTKQVKTSVDNNIKKMKPDSEEVHHNSSGSEYIPSDYCSDDYDSDNKPVEKCETKFKKRTKSQHMINKIKDDGNLQCYKARLEEYYKQLQQLNEQSLIDEDNLDYHLLEGGLKVPIKIWENLYSYQQEGVEWLWKIHQKSTGCLLGDEMGLGKTVQVIAFLSSLEYSRIVSKHGRFTGLGPTLIVCPATVIHQWVKHFHDWSPKLRVAVLHQSGSYQGNKVHLIKEMNKNKGIIITTYLAILKYKGNLREYDWHYFILDEGHKIRNSTAKVTIAIKSIRTPHRIMLTGSPMQNNLQELWSLFDFTNPGMLGTLMTFTEHFANPIVQGGFANASVIQEATAHSVATTLRNIISPFLLRRSKNEVQDDICLPNKSEQVLFCSLTDEQRDLYKGYLLSDQVSVILGRSKHWYSENQMKSNILVAITTLKKICNHPDLYLSEGDDNNEFDKSEDDDENFGYYKRSGKMVVVSALLKIWKKQKHRVLLFTQGRAMITVFEDFLTKQGYSYLKMDGMTSISSRQPLINKFNQDNSYDVFLLTTRVGGLGVNLTGADRVIIYDPDWNPATDVQARERAWRIGQDKQVTIYRLLSAGTIEEKIYQRQVWKQLLSNKILVNPETNRLFKSSDLYDLFSLPDHVENSNPETTNIFRDSRVKLQEKLLSVRKKKKVKKSAATIDNESIKFSDDKIQEMKNLAQRIARGLTTDSKEKSKQVPKKTSFQIELEVEREKRLKEKQELKQLSAAELMYYNREKAKEKPEDPANKVDDCETDASFSKALQYSEHTAKLYNKLKNEKVSCKLSESDSKDDKTNDNEKKTNREKRKKHSKHKKDLKFDSIIDNSGKIDGEEVDGLVKREIKKMRKESGKKIENESQDDYVLGKLFLKKGVSGALHHDSIVQSNVKSHNLKVSAEAERKADLAYQAIKKSRLKDWRW